MDSDKKYNYEEFMLQLNEVLDMIVEAIKNNKPLSLGRYGHTEVPYMASSYLPGWVGLQEPYKSYLGATGSISMIQNDLIQSLKSTDIVGLHASWGRDREDRETAKLTSKLLKQLDIIPKHVCSAFIIYEMINSNKFWDILKNHKIALVGRRAQEAIPILKKMGIRITHTIGIEGYEEIEKVYNYLSKEKDWDIALVSAGLSATILAPMLANQLNKVVLDFGHALDKLIDGDNFNYEKILSDWNEAIKKEILVSMVMTVYNGENFLKESIDAALSQTYKNIEVIIVNNGSTDSTKKIVDSINDKRLKIIHLKDNKGIAKALNIGIKEAKGSWIAIQDADDNSYPNRIEEQVKYITEHPELVAVGSFIECISEGSITFYKYLNIIEKNRNSIISRKDIRDMIYWGCPLTHSTVMFSKKAFDEVGGYSTDYKIASDYDLWLRLLEKGEIENVPKVLLQYRIHKDSLSNQNKAVTLNEIQIVSSRGICRRFNKGGKYEPNVVVIGPRKACINYKKYIAPVSGLKVNKFIYKDFNNQVSNVANMIKKRKLDAIIVLNGSTLRSTIEYLKRKNLKLNEEIFYIYNTLE